jgi:cation:H+ antiporter
MIVWLQFLALAAVILVAGTNISKYGDVIAEKSGLGRTWVGAILIASVTSLPELITGVSSVALYNVPNIAVGDVLGSCLFNLLLIALLDALSPKVPATTRSAPGHSLVAAFGVLLLGIVSFSIVAGPSLPKLGWIDISTLIVLGVYLLAMRLSFTYERREAKVGIGVAEAVYGHISARRAYVLYTVNALFIVAAATYLPYVGAEIADMTGLGTVFVGSLFIALTTSLPEIVVSITAARLGAIDLAFGNLLGSNLFNLAILAIDDVFYRQGALLASVTMSQLTVALAAIAMTAVVIIALAYRPLSKRLPLSWDAIGLVAIYLVAITLLGVMS